MYDILRLPHKLFNIYHTMVEVYVFVFGKNVCSVSYTSNYVVYGIICVAAIGACVFRARLRLRTFY